MTVLELADKEQFASFYTEYEQKNTIQHWQLRDLIHSDSTGNCVYCVEDYTLFKFDTRNRKSQLLHKLNFKPTSLTTKGQYLAAGGSQQELCILDVSGSSAEVKWNDKVGGTVNNALHLNTDSTGKDLLFVCNNDDTVKIFNLEKLECNTITECDTIRFEVAINYASMSPCGQYLVCVGDRPQVYIYQATPTGYEKVHTFTEAQDAGMCCDWAPNGQHFACAHQDGCVCIWDTRSKTVAQKREEDNAIRCVKFSSGPMDLLAYSQNVGTAHIVDARNLSQVQTLNVAQDSPINYDSYDISGLSFSPDGSRVYVGVRHGIVQYNVNSLLRRGFGEGRTV